jgi:hypothetical protein
MVTSAHIGSHLAACRWSGYHKTKYSKHIQQLRWREHLVQSLVTFRRNTQAAILPASAQKLLVIIHYTEEILLNKRDALLREQ